MTASEARSAVLQRVRLQLYGLAFLLVVALALVMTVLLYNKAFTPTVNVTLRTDRAGLQLLEHSDVKVRGLIVGEVDSIDVTDSGAAIGLSLKPDQVHLIPSNVSARLLPKTIFGEKYVDLSIPEEPARAIRQGDRISQDKSATATEITEVLDNLMPLLRTLDPQKVNSTLNALATALDGRGDQLGQTVEQTDAYLRKINPKLPTLMHDIRALGDVADIYDSATPDLMRTLRNLNVTSETIVDKRPAIDKLMTEATDTADNTERFLRANEDRIVGVNVATRDTLRLLAEYSPTLPCVVEGMAQLRPTLEEAMGGSGPTVRLTIEFVPAPDPYEPKVDKPKYADYRDPRCYGLPDPKVPFPKYQMLDGTEESRELMAGNGGSGGSGADGSAGRSPSSIFIQPGASPSGEVDKRMLDGVLGPMMRTPADQVPDVASLLFGPMAQGSVVKVE